MENVHRFLAVSAWISLWLVTDIPDVKNEDEVILIGRDGDECITMEEVGDLSGRFNYEFACDLGKRIPRVYIHGGRIIGTRDHFSE